jgi:hypothetical protein
LKRPWIRLYTEVPHDPKVQRLPPDLFKFWINCLCLSSENGALPPPEDIAFVTGLRPIRVRNYLAKLEKADLIDSDSSAIGAFNVHNWDRRQFASDLSNERVKKHRKRYRNVTATVTETPPEQSRAEQSRIIGASPPVLRDVLGSDGVSSSAPLSVPPKAEKPGVESEVQEARSPGVDASGTEADAPKQKRRLPGQTRLEYEMWQREQEQKGRIQ